MLKTGKANILLLGGGNMGAALAEGWLKKGLKPKRLTILEPDAKRRSALANSLKVEVVAKGSDFAETYLPDIVFVAVKPQQLEAAVKPLEKRLSVGALIISIAAGKTLKSLEAILPEKTAMVRAMPNLPVAVGQGMTVLVANRFAREKQKKIAEKLFKAVGKVLWLKQEKHMDEATAISGSGPAYVFYFLEALDKAARASGFTPEEADLLVRQTALGAAKLAIRSNKPLSQLREEVTSPGGTTEAALKVLAGSKDITPAVKEAAAAAARRSKQLAN